MALISCQQIMKWKSSFDLENDSRVCGEMAKNEKKSYQMTKGYHIAQVARFWRITIREATITRKKQLRRNINFLQRHKHPRPASNILFLANWMSFFFHYSVGSSSVQWKIKNVISQFTLNSTHIFA